MDSVGVSMLATDTCLVDLVGPFDSQTMAEIQATSNFREEYISLKTFYKKIAGYIAH